MLTKNKVRQRAPSWLNCCFMLLSCFSTQAFARELCFSLAENYYEQLYCELEALGKGRELPSFGDFRNNDETTRALLLKRTATKVGITVAMPGRKTIPKTIKVPQAASTGTTYSQPKSTTQFPVQSYPGLPDCEMRGVSILCNETRYQFIGNQNNSALKSGALSAENLMAMPAPPAIQGTNQIESYLKQAYQVYLEKMLEIGLGGVTMHFNKFSYFYYDISDKGVSFNGRFETMYKFLKKDKQNMAVSKTEPPDSSLALSNCLKAAQTIIACAKGSKNYLFVSVH